MTRQRHRDPLEWRNDRLARHDLYVMFGQDVERASVALAVYQAQERRPEPRRDEGERDGS